MTKTLHNLITVFMIISIIFCCHQLFDFIQTKSWFLNNEPAFIYTVLIIGIYSVGRLIQNQFKNEDQEI